MRTLIVFLVLASAVATAQQPTAVANGVILGRVVDAATKAPIGGVVVEIGGSPGSSAPGASPFQRIKTLTDDQGRFVFRQLLPGSYNISATTGSNGFEQSGFLVTGMGHLIAPYLNGGFGQRRPNGPLQNLVLDQGAVVADAVISLWKSASIEGAVSDETSEPLVGMTVAAVRRTSDGIVTTGPTTRTDDRGMYRISGLAPGDYVVVVPQTQVRLPASAQEAAPAPEPASALRSSSSSHLYVSTFHPAATTLDQAGVIALRSGDDATGIDVQLSPTPAMAVSGILLDGALAVPHFAVRLMPMDSADGAEVMEVASTATDASGRFTFPLVPVGQYRVVAQKEGGVAVAEPQTVAETPGAWAEGLVTVTNLPMEDVVLTLKPGYRVSGRVAFDGAGPAPPRDRVSQFSFSAVPAKVQRRHTPTVPRAPIDASNRMSIAGVAPGRYVLKWPEAIAGWSVESVMLGGRDVTDAAFEVRDADVPNLVITFTDQPASLGGTVRTTAGIADYDAAVFLFPVDRSRWPDASTSTRIFRTVRADPTGLFVFPNVIPGDYLVAAVADSLATDWPDQRLLARLGAIAVPIRVLPRQRTSVPLVTLEVR